MSTSNTPTPPRIPFFKPGDLTAHDGRQVSFSAADLQEIVDSYDPALSRAPMVVGHPDLDKPAYGWAKALTVEDGLLVAEGDQVEAQFAQMVNDGRFPNRSASIYLPNSPGNPKPGSHYLKHIGFLGAAPPAIPGLPAVQLAAADGALSFSFGTADLSPTVEPSMPEKNPNPAAPDPAVNFAQREAQLDARAQALQAREDKFKADQLQAERAVAVNFAQSLVTAGKLLPAEQDSIVELIMVLPGNDAPVSFSQAGATVSKPAREMFREFLGALPERVDYAEKSQGKQAQAAPVNFAAPQGAQVDAARADQYAQAKEIQFKNPGMSFADAARLAGA